MCHWKLQIQRGPNLTHLLSSQVSVRDPGITLLLIPVNYQVLSIVKSQQSFSNQPGRCCPSSALPRSSPGSIKSLKLECLPPAHLHPNVFYPAARVFSQHTLYPVILCSETVGPHCKKATTAHTENTGSVRDRSDWRKEVWEGTARRRGLCGLVPESQGTWEKGSGAHSDWHQDISTGK